LSSIIIRRRVSETTASITLLCNNSRGAFSSREAAAAVCAVRVCCAISGDELCADGKDWEGDWRECQRGERSEDGGRIDSRFKRMKATVRVFCVEANILK